MLRPEQREFFGDTDAARLYAQSIEAVEALGGVSVEVNLQPFLDVAQLLYAGPWVAERLAALQAFFALHAREMHPVVREIIGGAAKYSAVDGFQAQHRLGELRRETDEILRGIHVMLLPTTGTTYTIAEVEADPITLNSNLGHYTNFVNLLDLAAVAVPAGFRSNGLPFGVTVLGPAGTDQALLTVADRLHRRLGSTLGGLHTALSDTPPVAAPVTPPGCTLVAVVGAHLSGQPLNHQLTSRGARLAHPARTAASYRLYALPNTMPPKPGLVRDPDFHGTGIELEVWAVPTRNFGSFVAEVPAPLGIGSVQLADGLVVKGFICEPFAVAGATEITHLGGWRAYLAAPIPL